MFEVKKLTQKYRFGTLAFSNISFLIEKGDVLCILGKGESGKTSLLKTLCGINKPESGSIIVDNKDYTYKPIRDRNFFLLHENYGFFTHKTVFYNLSYPLRIRKISLESISKKISDISREFGLENILNEKIIKISEDDKIIVAIARAKLQNRQAYLFDNPFAHAKNRQELFVRFLPFFKALKQNSYLIYATDDVREAEMLQAKTLVTHYGYAHQCATIEELKNNPLSCTVYDLFHLDYIEDKGIIVQRDNGEIFLQTKQTDYPLLKNALLNEIFIEKEVLVRSSGNQIKIFDPISEKIIYFENIIDNPEK